MQPINLMVNGKPLIFTGQSVSYDGYELFYTQMSNIAHRGGDQPAYVFDYNGKRMTLPYDPKDKAVTLKIFQQVAAMEKKRKEQAAQPEPPKEEPIAPTQEAANSSTFNPTESQVTTPTPQPELAGWENDTIPQKNKKMKECKSCGKEIAKTAKSCPYCGAKNKKPIYKRWWFIAVIAIIILIIISSILSDNEKKNATYEKVNATTIMQDYNKNEVSADEKYKDKYLEITGKVGSIGNDIADDTYITLEDTSDEWAITSVQCYFINEDQINKLSSLKEGDKVTVKGKCTGLSLNVIVEDCQLVE